MLSLCETEKGEILVLSISFLSCINNKDERLSTHPSAFGFFHIDIVIQIFHVPES